MYGVFELTAQLNVVILIIHREKNSSQLQSGLRLILADVQTKVISLTKTKKNK